MSLNITRRSFLGTAAMALAARSYTFAKPSAEKPNILFMAIDDLNDWIGCLGGHPDTKTPNLDRLASKSLLFTNAFCAAPACNPSRAALMTGIRPSTSGVYFNSQPWRKSKVLKEAVTLPQYFRAHGYKAMGSGKIYHGRYPDPPSWDYYWPSLTTCQPADPAPKDRPLNGIPKTGHFDWGPVDARPEDMGDWKVADWIIDQLNSKQKKPFFLACGFYRPHLPWYVPQKYFDMHPLESIELPKVKQDDLDDVPEAGKRMARLRDHRNVIKYHQWRKAVQAYLASISFADEMVGRVVDAFEKSAYADNTILVLWSDHGWHLGEKLHWRKFALWEEATHNVLMMRTPGMKTGGQRCERPVNLLDIYPTLLELAGLSKKADVEGRSLVPLLHNPDMEWRFPTVTTYGPNNHSVRSKRWRYTRYAEGSEELYDHKSDEMEWTNLAGEKQFASVKHRLARLLPKVNAAPSPERK